MRVGGAWSTHAIVINICVCAPKKMKNKPSSAPVGGRRRLWSWQHYLNQQNAEAAPLALFTESQGFPTKKSAFKVGMKLEGIDPLHPNMFCVMTVAEATGCRLRVHFDGYSECYDFWLNSHSDDIRPAGWCRRNRRRLHPPKGCSESDFDWSLYLQSTGAQAAPQSLFACRTASCGFQVGMKLEAVDKKNPGLVCVASVADVVDDRILVHFDNWDNSYDYWCESSSPLINPVGWCEEHGRPLIAPHGHPDPENFTWEEYLRESALEAAPRSAFTPRAPHAFQIDQKLEAVDKRNPVLIRVATVTETDDHRVKVHYDGWSHHFDVWCDSDLADLHPVGWCQRTGHPLEVPPDWSSSPSHSQGVCPTSGCRGVGHIKGPKYTGHHSAFGCPYSDMNMRKELQLPDRLGGVATNGPGHPSQGGSNEVKTESGDSLLPPVAKRRRMTDRKSTFLPVKAEEEERKIQACAPEALHQSVFLSAMSAPPTCDPSLCWEQHRKLLPGVTRVRASAVRHWSVQQVPATFQLVKFRSSICVCVCETSERDFQVCAFVESLPGCEDLAKQFGDEQIDGRAFLLLTQRDIIRIMSIKLGPALKIYNSILMFRHEECKSREEAAQPHHMNTKQSHNSDENSSHDEDKNQAHDVDENQSGSEEKNENQSHDGDKNRSGCEDEDPKHEIDIKHSDDMEKNQSGYIHEDDDVNKNRSHDMDRNQSCDETGSQSHDQNQSGDQ
ncbi:lethal(3)malignant brain tumor-like protein 4 isoform X2 [Vanacampus margaritifer]